MSAPDTSQTFGITGSLSAVWIAARQTVYMLAYRRTLWWSLPGCGALFLLTFVAGLRAPDQVSGESVYCVFAWWGLSTVVVPWVAAFLGVQAVHGELEDRTSQYLFLRPVSRTPLLLGKWLAVSAMSVAVTLAAVGALFLGIAQHQARWPDGVAYELPTAFGWSMGLGAVAYSAVAVLFGATFRRPLAWSAFFIVGIQIVVANLPVSAGLRQVTVTDPLRRLVLDWIEPDRRLARIMWPSETAISVDDIGSPVLNLAILTGVCLGLACWKYASAEYESRSRD